MVGPEEEPVQVIAHTIQRYLEVNPDAADSAEGIRRWWLPPALAEESPGTVEEALDRLVAAGVISRRPLPDGRVLYAKRGATTCPSQ
jgi:hypothetical protein